MDDDKSDLVRMLATQSIQIKPPSLEMSKPIRKKIPGTPLPRSVSMASISDTSRGAGGIKQWWEKFSGRFKRLNRIEMINGSDRERLMSVNDLQYSELLPTSPVYTLGFKDGRSSEHGSSANHGGLLQGAAD